MPKLFTFMYESRHSRNYINSRKMWRTRVFRELPHPGAKVRGCLPPHPNKCFFGGKKTYVTKVIWIWGFILPTLVTNQNTEFASCCQALFFLPLITSCVDRTLINEMLAKCLARIAMNVGRNILPLRLGSFSFFLSYLNFVIPVRF